MAERGKISQSSPKWNEHLRVNRSSYAEIYVAWKLLKPLIKILSLFNTGCRTTKSTYGHLLGSLFSGEVIIC